MYENITLDRLEKGKGARVQKLCANPVLRRRLIDMGFVKNAKIECVEESPMGNPRAYKILSFVIALRNEDARDIMVRRV